MDNMIKLNVGGVIYYTTLTTLTSCPGSSLSKMFGSSESAFIPSSKDESGAYIIDSSPTVFECVLDWCRYRKLVITNSKLDWESLEAVADYFLLEDMKKAIVERKEAESEIAREKRDTMKKISVALQNIEHHIEKQTEETCDELFKINRNLDCISSNVYRTGQDIADSQSRHLQEIDRSLVTIYEELQVISGHLERQIDAAEL